MRDFMKIPDNTQSDVAVVLRGLGTQGEPHTDFISFFVGMGMEVYFYDRRGDVLLQNLGAIEIYCQEVSSNITSLVLSGKRVHLVGISFGGFLSFKIVGDTNSKVSSIVAIAPLIDPYSTVSRISEYNEDGFASVRLANDLQLSILPENIDSLIDWKPKEITIPGMVIMGDNDEFEYIENLERITGKEVTKHILPGTRHEDTTGHPKTQELLQGFYSRIIR